MQFLAAGMMPAAVPLHAGCNYSALRISKQ